MEIQEDLKSEAIWYNFRPDSENIKFLARVYFHVWNKNYYAFQLFKGL